MHRQWRPRHGPRGQAVAEFAVVATLLATLLGGVLEFGRLWSAAQVLNSAVRDGARLAAVVGKSNRVTLVTSRIESSASTYFTSKDIKVQVQEGKGASNEPIITVGVTGDMTMLFGNWLLGKNIKLYRAATVRDETIAGP